MTPLDALIQQRTGGAVNVRGVRFQIRYTLWRALRAHARGGTWRVVPEGLEDADITEDGVTDHVQVKTSDDRWAPHTLKDAFCSLAGAARVLPEDAPRTFTILLAGEVNTKVRAFADRHTLPPAERRPLDSHLAKIIRKAGADGPLADRLAVTVRVHVQDPADLTDRLSHAAVQAFGTHPESAGLVAQALTAFVLHRAERRQPFGPDDLARAYAAIAQGQTVAARFEAHGLNLIGPVDWTPAPHDRDFLDGRGTRAAHVAADLDVPRPRWTDRIDEVLAHARLCVVRAPSGQGKSALALRYARDHWTPEDTLELRSCATPQEAQQAIAYLRARADLGLPTSLLIDGADWQLQHWPDVAATARDRGIPVLVTVRVEDWRRFAAGTSADLGPDPTGDGQAQPTGATGPLADAAIVEPHLDLGEAQDLFRHLQTHGRVHVSVPSAEDAFERVGQPALLMEYVYLVTHGELLRHRLLGQVRVLQERGDDGHLAVLRLATFAHACGVPAPALPLLDGRPEDPQRVFSQIDGEYVSYHHGDLAELHRVRSEHLAEILHVVSPTPTDTARTLLPLLPADRLAPFVAGALRYPGVSADGLRQDLVALATRLGPQATAAVADGLFEAGERTYVEAVGPAFDQAETILGSSGPFFLSTLLAPAAQPDILDATIAAADAMSNGSADRLREIRALAQVTPRGLRGDDRLRDVLPTVLRGLAPAVLAADPGPSGRLLQDAARLGLEVPVLDVLSALALPTPDAVPDVAALLTGLHAHAPDQAEQWVRDHRDALGQAAALHLGLVGPPTITSGPDGPAIEIAFYPSDEDDAPSLNDQAVSRLRTLRELYPFAAHFRSHAYWIVPDDLVPTHDESTKDMTPQYLRPRLFRDRQGLWNMVGKERAASPTFWAYQQAWHRLRTLALDYADVVEQAIRAAVEGRPFDLARELDRGNLENDLHAALRHTAQPPTHTSLSLVQSLKGAKAWETPFDNVVRQLSQYARTRDSHTGRLLRYNAYQAVAAVPEMHRAFEALSERAPDSFGLRSLHDRERQTYATLAAAVEFWTDPPVPLPVSSLRKTLQSVHDGRDDALRRRVQRALGEAGVEPSLGPVVLRDGTEQTVVLGVPTEHPCNPEPVALAGALFALADLGETAPSSGRPGTVWIALTADGARFQEPALRFFSHQLGRLAADGDLNWESFAPLPPPPPVAAALGALPLRVHTVYQAWQAAYAAHLLGRYVGQHLGLDPADHPQAADRLPALLERAETGIATLADALRSTPEPAPANAVERLGGIARAVGRGTVPADETLALIRDLEAHGRSDPA